MKKINIMIVYVHPYFIKNQTQNRDKLPLGSLYAIVAAKKANPAKIKFVNMAIVPTDYSFIDELESFQPDIVALGIHSAAVLPFSSELSRKIKNYNNECIVIAGGHYATGQAKECLKNSNIDYILMGEVDESLTMFINCVQEEKEINVPGLLRINSTVEVTPAIFKDLNTLPRVPEPGFDISPYTLWDPYLKGKTFILSSIRGCPHSCAYCCYRIVGNKKRRIRKGELLLNDIKSFRQEYGITRYNFIDDNFLCSPKRTKEFCEGIAEDGLSWRCQSRIDSFTPGNLVPFAKLLKQSGCYIVSFGLESADEELLKKINKPTDLTWTRKVCAVLKEYGVKVRIYIIVGLPYQTEESIELSKQFLRDIEPDFVSIEIFVPHKGSIIGDNPEEWGIIWETDKMEEKIQRLDWLANEANNNLKPCISTKWMDSSTIELKRNELLAEWPLPV